MYLEFGIISSTLDFHHRADVGQVHFQLGLQFLSLAQFPSLLALTWSQRFNIDHRLLDLPRRSRFHDITFPRHTRAL